MSDKINTLISFWKIKDEKPTGSKRSIRIEKVSNRLNRILIENKIDLDLGKLILII